MMFYTCPQVLRDFEAFENLQKDMLETFPKLKLPSLPRKYHLFLSDADVEERQISFDCLLKVYIYVIPEARRISKRSRSSYCIHMIVCAKDGVRRSQNSSYIVP